MAPTGLLPDNFDRSAMTIVNQGDCLVSNDRAVTFSTILGSCISACVRDTKARVGGMNHFLLAEQSGMSRDRYGASARYGAFAMERLINAVLTRGTGDKANLEMKIFGGGLINVGLADIGGRNIEFVREFLQNEGYRVAGEDLGGTFARRVLFWPATGRAFVKRLANTEGEGVIREELAIAGRRASAPPPPDDIELF